MVNEDIRHNVFVQEPWLKVLTSLVKCVVKWGARNSTTPPQPSGDDQKYSDPPVETTFENSGFHTIETVKDQSTKELSRNPG